MEPQLEVFDGYYIPQLFRYRSIRVLLPRNYFQDQDRRYPVIYMPDGQKLFDEETATYGHWKLREVVEKLPLRRQAILVGIDHAGTERINEYAPYTRGTSGGLGHATLEFYVDTVKPWVDSMYRTLPGREHTGIVGSSMGGLLAYYAAFEFNDVFGSAGVLSPSLWFNPAVLDLPLRIQGPRCKVYLAGGIHEMRGMEQALQLAKKVIQEAGYSDSELTVNMRTHAAHNEAYWGREFKHFMEWFFAEDQ